MNTGKATAWSIELAYSGSPVFDVMHNGAANYPPRHGSAHLCQNGSLSVYCDQLTIKVRVTLWLKAEAPDPVLPVTVRV